MSVSSNSLLGSQATGNKSNQLLAVLSSDNGAGNQVGPNFSQVLKGTSISPMPTPAPAPTPRVESKPSPAPTAAAAPKPAPETEPASHTEQAPAASGDESQSASAHAAGSKASKELASNAAASKVFASNAAASKVLASNTATSKVLASRAAALDAALSAATVSPLANEDSLLAGGKVVNQSEALEPIDAANKKNSKSIKTLPVEAQESPVPGLTPVILAVDQQRPMAQAAAPEAGAAAMPSLASLMPSVAQAVFPQDARAQAADASKPESKADVPTSTDERAKVLSARAQQTAALTNAEAPPTDAPRKELSTLNPDVSRTLVGENTQSSNAPSFSSVMQATHAASAAFAAPLNASASRAPVGSAAVHMKSDLQGPDFAPEMAARLTVLAGAGVQKAELHLNPAEMGPVSVKITLDGQEAQVQFHAQHALTREVLERSLPELAAALRDAGLTLSGGGVFQQPQDAKPDGQAQRSNAPGQSRDFGPDSGGSDAAPVTVRRTQVGVLDMYA